MDETRKRILCLGDSNTFGYDPRGYCGGRYPAETRWTGLLRAAGWDVCNKGMNGSVIPGEHEYPAFAAVIAAAQPLDTVTVMLGTNDVLRGVSAAEAAEHMARFLAAIRPSVGAAGMLLIAPPPMILGDWVQQDGIVTESREFAARYRETAAALQIAFADAGAWGVGLSFDGVHFTPEGHAAFFRGLSAALSACAAR